VFGVLNVLIKPVLFLMSLPFVVLTLGLFTLVLNAVMLLLTAGVSDILGLGFSVDGFVPALKGALVVTLVSFALSLLVSSDSDSPKRKEART
jgi:putative membrane protein